MAVVLEEVGWGRNQVLCLRGCGVAIFGVVSGLRGERLRLRRNVSGERRE